MEKRFSSSPESLEWPRDHPASYSVRTRVLSQGKSSEGVELTTDFHLVPKLRVRGATPQLTLHAFMAWTGITLPLTKLCSNSSSYAQDFLINDRHDIFESFKIMNAIGPTLTPGASSYMTPQYLAISRICFCWRSALGSHDAVIIQMMHITQRH